MDQNEQKLYGLLAKFDNQEDLLLAARRVAQAGYRDFDAYTPYPVEGLERAMRLKSSYLPWVIFAGGLIGGIAAFGMMTFATVWDYPLNIGGRPLFSWPAYIPITFEVTVLFAAFAGVLGLFFVTRFPEPYHPVFNSEDFRENAATDGFYLDIQSKDPKFDLQQTRNYLESLGATQVTEIEA